MRHQSRALTILALATIASAGAATTISLNAETQPGNSIFVSAPHPAFGDGDPTKAIKLSPHGYPVWSVRMDLPGGLELPLTFLRRADGPADLANPANGTVVATQNLVVSGDADGRHSWQEVFVADGSTTPTATLQVQGQSRPLQPEGFRASGAGGWLTFRIDAADVDRGARFSLQAGSTSLPGDGPMHVTRGTTWWRHGQAFLYPPPATVPTNPRVLTYTFVPSDPIFRGRTVRVLLPRGYEENPGRRYPLLFAQDGQNAFSPGGSFGSWDLDLTTTRLTARGEVPEIILAGFDNTQDRIPEYVPEYINALGITGRGGAFLRMIRDELLVDLGQRYRLQGGPENTAHLGSSLGGIIGFEAANERRDTFGAAIIMSPAFWIGPPAFQEKARRSPDAHARMWLDSGNTGQSNDDYANTVTIRDLLIQSGHAIGPDFHYTVGLGQQHNEAAWRQRTPEALRWLYRPLIEARSPEGWTLTSTPTGRSGIGG